MFLIIPLSEKNDRLYRFSNLWTIVFSNLFLKYYLFKAMSYLSDSYLTNTFFSHFAFANSLRYRVKTLSNQVKISKERFLVQNFYNYTKKCLRNYFLIIINILEQINALYFFFYSITRSFYLISLLI